MKKLLAFLLLATIVMVGFNACKKYEDGPYLSLRSKHNRVVNEWKLNKATNEGIDVTSQFQEYYFTFNDDNTYTYNRKLVKETGTWDFDDDKLNIILTPAGSSTTESYKIIRLKNDELTLDQTVGSQTTRYYYVTK